MSTQNNIEGSILSTNLNNHDESKNSNDNNNHNSNNSPIEKPSSSKNNLPITRAATPSGSSGSDHEDDDIGESSPSDSTGTSNPLSLPSSVICSVRTLLNMFFIVIFAICWITPIVVIATGAESAIRNQTYVITRLAAGAMATDLQNELDQAMFIANSFSNWSRVFVAPRIDAVVNLSDPDPMTGIFDPFSVYASAKTIRELNRVYRSKLAGVVTQGGTRNIFSWVTFMQRWIDGSFAWIGDFQSLGTVRSQYCESQNAIYNWSFESNSSIFTTDDEEVFSNCSITDFNKTTHEAIRWTFVSYEANPSGLNPRSTGDANVSAAAIVTPFFPLTRVLGPIWNATAEYLMLQSALANSSVSPAGGLHYNLTNDQMQSVMSQFYVSSFYNSEITSSSSEDVTATATTVTTKNSAESASDYYESGAGGTWLAMAAELEAIDPGYFFENFSTSTLARNPLADYLNYVALTFAVVEIKNLAPALRKLAPTMVLPGESEPTSVAEYFLVDWKNRVQIFSGSGAVAARLQMDDDSQLFPGCVHTLEPKYMSCFYNISDHRPYYLLNQASIAGLLHKFYNGFLTEDEVGEEYWASGRPVQFFSQQFVLHAFVRSSYFTRDINRVLEVTIGIAVATLVFGAALTWLILKVISQKIGDLAIEMVTNPFGADVRQKARNDRNNNNQRKKRKTKKRGIWNFLTSLGSNTFSGSGSDTFDDINRTASGSSSSSAKTNDKNNINKSSDDENVNNNNNSKSREVSALGSSSSSSGSGGSGGNNNKNHGFGTSFYTSGKVFGMCELEELTLMEQAFAEFRAVVQELRGFLPLQSGITIAAVEVHSKESKLKQKLKRKSRANADRKEKKKQHEREERRQRGEDDGNDKFIDDDEVDEAEEEKDEQGETKTRKKKRNSDDDALYPNMPSSSSPSQSESDDNNNKSKDAESRTTLSTVDQHQKYDAGSSDVNANNSNLGQVPGGDGDGDEENEEQKNLRHEHITRLQKQEYAFERAHKDALVGMSQQQNNNTNNNNSTQQPPEEASTISSATATSDRLAPLVVANDDGTSNAAACVASSDNVRENDGRLGATVVGLTADIPSGGSIKGILKKTIDVLASHGVPTVTATATSSTTNTPPQNHREASPAATNTIIESVTASTSSKFTASTPIGVVVFNNIVSRSRRATNVVTKKKGVTFSEQLVATTSIAVVVAGTDNDNQNTSTRKLVILNPELGTDSEETDKQRGRSFFFTDSESDVDSSVMSSPNVNVNNDKRSSKYRQCDDDMMNIHNNGDDDEDYGEQGNDHQDKSNKNKQVTNFNNNKIFSSLPTPTISRFGVPTRRWGRPGPKCVAPRPNLATFSPVSAKYSLTSSSALMPKNNNITSPSSKVAVVANNNNSNNNKNTNINSSSSSSSTSGMMLSKIKTKTKASRCLIAFVRFLGEDAYYSNLRTAVSHLAAADNHHAAGTINMSFGGGTLDGGLFGSLKDSGSCAAATVKKLENNNKSKDSPLTASPNCARNPGTRGRGGSGCGANFTFDEHMTNAAKKMENENTRATTDNDNDKEEEEEDLTRGITPETLLRRKEHDEIRRLQQEAFENDSRIKRSEIIVDAMLDVINSTGCYLIDFRSDVFIISMRLRKAVYSKLAYRFVCKLTEAAEKIANHELQKAFNHGPLGKTAMTCGLSVGNVRILNLPSDSVVVSRPITIFGACVAEASAVERRMYEMIELPGKHAQMKARPRTEKEINEDTELETKERAEREQFDADRKGKKQEQNQDEDDDKIHTNEHRQNKDEEAVIYNQQMHNDHASSAHAIGYVSESAHDTLAIAAQYFGHLTTKIITLLQPTTQIMNEGERRAKIRNARKGTIGAEGLNDNDMLKQKNKIVKPDLLFMTTGSGKIKNITRNNNNNDDDDLFAPSSLSFGIENEDCDDGDDDINEDDDKNIGQDSTCASHEKHNNNHHHLLPKEEASMSSQFADAQKLKTKLQMQQNANGARNQSNVRVVCERKRLARVLGPESVELLFSGIDASGEPIYHARRPLPEKKNRQTLPLMLTASSSSSSSASADVAAVKRASSIQQPLLAQQPQQQQNNLEEQQQERTDQPVSEPIGDVTPISSNCGNHNNDNDTYGESGEDSMMNGNSASSLPPRSRGKRSHNCYNHHHHHRQSKLSTTSTASSNVYDDREETGIDEMNIQVGDGANEDGDDFNTI